MSHESWLPSLCLDDHKGLSQLYGTKVGCMTGKVLSRPGNRRVKEFSCEKLNLVLGYLKKFRLPSEKLLQFWETELPHK